MKKDTHKRITVVLGVDHLEKLRAVVAKRKLVKEGEGLRKDDPPPSTLSGVLEESIDLLLAKEEKREQRRKT